MRLLPLLFLLIGLTIASAITTSDWPSKLDNGFNVSTQTIVSPIIFTNSSGTFQTATYYMNRTTGGSNAFWNVLNSLSGNSLRFKNPINATGLVIQGVKNLTRYIVSDCYDWLNETSGLNKTVCDYVKQVSFDTIPLSSVVKDSQSEYIYTFTAPWGKNHFNFTTYFDPDWSVCGIYNTSGTYDLTGNVSQLGGNCFTVNASNITIDCHGFSIIGNNTTSTKGVYSNTSNTTIKNCIIQNFSTGIYINTSSANYSTITNNTVNQTTTASCSASTGLCSAIFIRSASYANVANNSVQASVAGGNGYGINLYSSTFNTLTNNTATLSTYGFYVAINSLNNILTNNNATSPYYGFYLTSSSNALSNNYIQTSSTSSSYAALTLSSVSDSNITNNTIVSNSTGAPAGRVIYISSGSNNRFTNNTLISNSTASTIVIYIDSSGTNNTFLQNNITAPVWVTDNNGLNYYNDSSVGNIYYYPNGTGAWQVLNITASSGNWADGGADRPLEAFIPQWFGGGQDYHPFTTISGTADGPTPHCGALAVANSITTLTSNRSINGLTCFTIFAANVTLDCAGFNIIGNNTAGTKGVVLNLNTTVRNCVIRNFSADLFADSDAYDNITLVNNTLYMSYSTSCSNQNGICVAIFLKSADSALVENNTMIMSDGSGYGVAIYSSATSHVIRNNNVYGSNWVAYSDQTNSGNLFTGNNASNSQAAGFASSTSMTSGTYTNNYVFNSGTGFSAANSVSGITVSGNRFYNISGVSLSSSGATNSIFTNNYAETYSTSTTSTGTLYLSSSSTNNNFTNNTFNSTAASGTYATYLNSAKNNRFINNTLIMAGTTNPAIRIWAVASGNNTFLGNNITGAKWVTDLNDTNYYNNSNSGNIYYYPNGTGAWQVSPNGTALTTTSPPNWNTNTSAWINATTFSGSWTAYGTDFFPWTNNAAGEAPAASNYTNITAISIWPTSPTTNLSCNITAQNSVQATMLVNITFYKNGVNQTTNATYNISNNTVSILGNITSLTGGDNWSCSGVAWSSVNTSVLNMSANVTVAGGGGSADYVNIIALSLTPVSPYVISTLQCSATANSSNSTSINISYSWLKNGVNQTAYAVTYLAANNTALIANLTLNSTVTSKGDNWSCAVWASDSINSSGVNYSLNRTIINSLPVNATISTIQNLSWHTFNFTAYADDSDNGTNITTWSVNISGGSCVNVSNSAAGNRKTVKMNCTYSNPSYISFNITFIDTSNEINYSATSWNTYPDLNNVSLAAPTITGTATVGNTLTCNNQTWADADGDVENLTARTWQWYNGTTAIGGQTASTFLIPAGWKGSQVKCKESVVAQNWTTSSASNNSTLTTILNSAPTVPTADTLVPAAPVITDTLTGGCSGSTDADGDVLTYYIKFHDNTDAADRTVFITPGTYALVSPIDSHDQFKIYCYASDGTDISSTRTGTTIRLIGNTVPTVPSNLLPNGGEYFNTTSINVNWTVSTDADGDAITYYVNWSNDSGATWYLLVNVVASDTNWDVTGYPTLTTYRIRIYAGDGYGFSSDVVSAADFTINQTAPPAVSGPIYVSLMAPSNGTNYTTPANVSLQFNCSGDSASYLVNITMNGTVIATAYPCTSNATTTYVYNTSTNATHTWNVTAYNSTQQNVSDTRYFGTWFNNSNPANATISGFVNSTTTHSFNVSAYVDDSNGGADITTWNWSISLGTCVNASNSVSGFRRYINLTCTSTTSGTAQINISFSDSYGLTSNTTTSSNTYPYGSAALTPPVITPAFPIMNDSFLNCTPGVFSTPFSDTENISNRSWRWFLNGSVMSGKVNQTLVNSSYGDTDVIICEETASNNTWGGSASTNSSSVTIGTSLTISTAIIYPPTGSSYGPAQCRQLVTVQTNDTAPAGATRSITCRFYNWNGIANSTYTLNGTETTSGGNASVNFTIPVSSPPNWRVNCTTTVSGTNASTQTVSFTNIGNGPAWCNADGSAATTEPLEYPIVALVIIAITLIYFVGAWDQLNPFLAPLSNLLAALGMMSLATMYFGIFGLTPSGAYDVPFYIGVLMFVVFGLYLLLRLFIMSWMTIKAVLW